VNKVVLTYVSALTSCVKCKSPNIDQIPTELIKAGGRKFCSEIH